MAKVNPHLSIIALNVQTKFTNQKTWSVAEWNKNKTQLHAAYERLIPALKTT